MSGMERNANSGTSRKMTPDEILKMFQEVQEKDASKSYDFPISNLLDQYMQGCIIPNFMQAAMVILNAGIIYSRKVDHLQRLLMAMSSMQNEPTERTEGTDNAEQSNKKEKKRAPTKRQKALNQLKPTIVLAAPKQIKKIAAEEKIKKNSSSTSYSDRFKHFCKALKSKTPVFYERVNLLISEAKDNCFDGTRPISKDDPDCQKNYCVFVGCISFRENQLMSQRELLSRIQFDDMNGTLNISTALPPGHILNSTRIDINEHAEQSSIDAGTSMNATENDMFESLRDTSLLNDKLHETTNNTEDFDSAIMDGSSQVNSTVEQSTINDSTNINDSSQANSTAVNDSTIINSTAEVTSNTNEIAGNSTLFGSELANSTIDVTNSNQINSDSTCDGVASLSTSNLMTESGHNSMSGELPTNSICLNDSQLTTPNGTAISDTQIDPLGSNGPVNESTSTVCNNSETEKSERYDDSRNIFRIDEEYLKLREVFRLPLNILEQEIRMNLNIFGVPFGRLRRHVKFALPKDFDPSKTLNKRTKDSDENSTIARKFVKLNDGTATPTVEINAEIEQNIPTDGNQFTVELTVTPLVPPSSDIPFELVNDLTESLYNDTDLGGDIDDHLTNVSQTLEDGPSPPKIPRLENQIVTVNEIDSGIGTLTEQSVIEGTITNRRESLYLTPTFNPIDNETIEVVEAEVEAEAEAEEQSANRIQEMTNLSEKVSSWHKRLKPILNHSENRNDFSVKDTCRNIVGCFKNRDTITFKDVMEVRDKADTARLFFSMLQMANNKNIEITVNHHDSSTLCPTDQIKLKLLNSTIRDVDPNIR